MQNFRVFSIRSNLWKPDERPVRMKLAKTKRRKRTATQPSAAHAKLTKPPSKPFPIVGVGASAGGLEAISQLLKHLPQDTGMGFVLVQHLSPDHESALTQLLERVTSLPVSEVVDNVRVEPNHVYVIPPNASLAVTAGVLKVQARARGRSPHLPIDSFFESLAQDQQHWAIGVILSGTASDGTLGIGAIKAEGGITFAQDDSARYDSMPRSAIAAGCIDFVLPPDKIAEELARLAKHLSIAGPLVAPDATAPMKYAKAKAPADPESAKRAGFRKILTLLHNHSGVDFSLYKPNTIQRRIARRLVLNKIGAEDYAKLLRDQPKELEALYSDVLINVTSFFRNPGAFDALRHKVFPKLIHQPRDQPVRFWILGCSTGQEAYSLAMAFFEFTEESRHPCKLQIFATDVNEALLEKARVGAYARGLVQNLSPERLRRFFVEEDGGFRVAKFVRESIVFARQNLLSDPPFSRMDLISCRNLLIYLDSNLQKKILPSFHYALKPEGFLFLGESETIGSFAEFFDSVDKRYKIFSNKQGVVPHLFFAPRHPSEKHAQPAPKSPETSESPGPINAQREADRITLNRFAPPAVLVDDHSQIVQFRGDTSPYLRPPAGSATFDVLKMAREGLMLPLRAALKEARQEKRTVRRRGVLVVESDRKRPVKFEVIPLTHLKERCCLVFFESDQPSSGPAPRPGPRRPEPRLPVRSGGPAGADAPTRRRVLELERELSESRDYLQSLQEQYEAATEELQSSNEEVTSANEELQSINEELETSKEELESTNEELVTVNEELAGRNAELSRSNADLSNLHASVNLAIVVLTRDLAIRRFTPSAQKLFNLLDTDLGRPLSNVRHNLQVPDLDELLRQVIDTFTERELEVQDKDGRWYSMRLRPYLTLDKKIDGAVLVLVDIDALKRSEREIAAARDYAEAILRTVRYPLVVLSADLRVSIANAAFYKKFLVSPAETEGRRLYELGNRQWDIPLLRQALEDILPRNSFFEDFEVTQDFEKIGQRSLLLNARRLETEQKDGRILLAIDDITETKQTHRLHEAQAELMKSNEELEKQIQNRTVKLRETVAELEAFSYSISHDMRAPLRSMQGFAHILLEKYQDKLDVAGRDFLQRIERSATRLDALIQDVLSYTRIVRAQVPLEPVNLDRLVRDIVDSYPEWQPANAQIEVENTLPTVLGNQAWLTQCFSNLLNNAVKFVAPGVQPSLRIWSEDVPLTQAKGQKPQDTAPPAPSSWARIFVQDNGIGIAPEDRNRIFRLFERIHPDDQYEGTGLGLTIVSKAVERMSGEIGFESELGKGSTFWIQLSKPASEPWKK